MSAKLLRKQSLHRLPWKSVVSLPHSGQKSVRVRAGWGVVLSCIGLIEKNVINFVFS